MVMARDQNAGRNHNMKIENSSIERVEEFKYLGTTLTSQNSILAEIKSRLKSGSACYHLVQNRLSYFAIQKFQDEIYKELQFCLLFFMGVRLGRSH
jgi:hypothetical protein